jgi:eukaryotic-like serine/threonine-protein kinase
VSESSTRSASAIRFQTILTDLSRLFELEIDRSNVFLLIGETMPAPTTTLDVAELLKKTNLLSESVIDDYVTAHPEIESPPELVAAMRADGLLTKFQADQILKGRYKGFVLGKYRLLDRIGMGGMGQVYLAEHMTMRRRVAVKVLPPDRSDNPFSKERFLREARAAALLEHPNLCRAYDLETDGDVTYIVMEYIEGVSLHELTMRRGPQGHVRVAHLLRQIALGLQCVHDRALIHRDIKPANLLMDKTGVVRILDLGLVRSELDDDALTRGEGAKVVGTADYLAPEQAVASSKVDGRADLYSLGCTAYFLLTGEPPFKTEKLSQKLIAHQTCEVKPVHLVRPTVPVEFSAVISKLLSKKPEHRYPSAMEVIHALEPWTREACPAPVPEDFPSKDEAVYGPNSLGLSLSSRINLASPSAVLGPNSSGRHALTGLSGVSMGSSSDVRVSPDLPKTSDSNQPTVANAAQETMRETKRPAVSPFGTTKPISPAPSPIVVPTMTPQSTVPTGKKDSFTKVAELFGTKVMPIDEPRVSWGGWLALAAAVLVLIAAGVAVMTLR